MMGLFRIAVAVVAPLLLSAPMMLANAQGLLDQDPLFPFARNGEGAAIDFLLMKGAKIGESTPEGETILHIAAANGHFPIVELALEQGARVDLEDKGGNTALTRATARGYTAIVERLLEAGANLNHQTGEGMTPVMLAVRLNRLSTLQSLLDRRPDLEVLDYTGRSAMDWARDGRDRRAENMLRRAGVTQ
ncbi:MAG: ankyrin repeat domain-containing protein [Pseudomonadota bacterium]